jgi:putative transposase
VVVPGLPHHITRRGNRREPVSFGAEDYRLYRRLIASAARRADAQIWAYCLMPNHVHLIGALADADGLRATFAEALRLYTGAINARFDWTGHLFQGRFGAVVMDERTSWRRRYIALNPVAAGLVRRAEDWLWSSASAQLAGEDDELATVAPLRALIPDFAALLAAPGDPATTARIDRRSPSDDRWSRNGSQRSSGEAGALEARAWRGLRVWLCRDRRFAFGTSGASLNFGAAGRLRKPTSRKEP